MLDTPVRERPPAAGHLPTTAKAGRAVVPALLATGAVLSGLATLFASRLSGTPAVPVLAGLPDAGEFTRLALPLARTAYDIAAIGVCGTLLLGIVLLPSGRADLAPAAEAAMRSASRWAASWAVSAVALLLLTLSDVLARPVPRVMSWEILGQFAYSFDTTRALITSALLAGLTAVAARSEPSRLTRALAVFLAAGALLPPLLAGHSGHARYHYLAVTSLSVHVLAASVWVGGLLALILATRRRLGGGHGALVTALPRFSGVALACLAAVGLSGALNAWIRLTALDQLWTTPYGRLALAKTAALFVLAGFGWLHRRRTIRAVRDGRSRAFVVLAATEVAVMLATVGLAVALSRTAPPLPPGHGKTVTGLAPATGFSCPFCDKTGRPAAAMRLAASQARQGGVEQS
jgi:putative copper export protein